MCMLWIEYMKFSHMYFRTNKWLDLEPNPIHFYLILGSVIVNGAYSQMSMDRIAALEISLTSVVSITWNNVKHSHSHY